MRKINFYLKRGQIAKDESVIALSNKYLEKAKNNIVTMQILSELENNKKVRKLLSIPEEYNPNEWVVICGYYSMYSCALALISKIGFRSKNHTATLLILDEFFVKKNYLRVEDLLIIKSAQFQKEEIEKISDARHSREIAQYSITKQTTKDIAEKIKIDAFNLINKVEEILENKII